jgi:hypothetical protein
MTKSFMSSTGYHRISALLANMAQSSHATLLSKAAMFGLLVSRVATTRRPEKCFLTEKSSKSHEFTVLFTKNHDMARLLWTFRTNMRIVYEVIRDSRSSQSEIIFTGAPPFM